MTFNQVQRIDNLDRLKALKQDFIRQAAAIEKQAVTNEEVAHEYCSLCDTVDWIHWRIKEITDVE